MRFRPASRILLCVSVLVLTAMGLTVTAQASTSSGDSLTASASFRLKPSEIVGCVSPVEPPYFLTFKKTTLYSSAKITKCTTPRPQECKLKVITEEQGEFGLWTELPGAGTKGYTTKCVGLSVGTKGYKCKFALGRRKFRTLEELYVEYHGAISTGVKDSKVIEELC